MLPKEKVRNLIDRHTKLEKELSSSEIDKKKYAEISKEYSNLKPIVDSFSVFKSVQENIDESSLDYFLRLSYIPSPLSIYKNIFKVKSGNMVSFNLNKNLFNEEPFINQWFSYKDFYYS